MPDLPRKTSAGCRIQGTLGLLSVLFTRFELWKHTFTRLSLHFWWPLLGLRQGVVEHWFRPRVDDSGFQVDTCFLDAHYFCDLTVT